ncbi:MAG: cytochrome c biogenesis protein CcsA [Acidimicrobiia bacterium]|nr:cytochrome c biogenesis protein CcsA [Acidimicrobiia bacterium]
MAWALLTMLAVAAFFFLLMAGPADPFRTFDPPPGYDGPGPNPLLQNHLLMAFHPPMLYLGYVGFTVPFAFAVAALVTGRVGEGWLVETRRWTLFAWGFLTVGIILGAWWSYEVLGWGGYWAWDPVENASFLPWLTGTAYLRSSGDGPGAAGHAPGVEPVAAVRHVRAHHPRDLHHPLRGPRVGARVHRIGHRAGAPRLLRPDRRGVGGADRLAWRPAPVARTHRLAAVGARRRSSATTCSSPRSPSSCCWGPCSLSWSRR